MEAVRERWTDDRMEGGQEGTREKSSRQELSELRTEMTHRFDRLQNMLLTGFFTLVATLVVTQVS